MRHQQAPQRRLSWKKESRLRKPKVKVKKDEQDDGLFDLFEKQTKVLEASWRGQEHYFQFLKELEERRQDLLIIAIRELGTVLGDKKGKKRAEEKLESSDEDWREQVLYLFITVVSFTLHAMAFQAKKQLENLNWCRFNMLS